MNKLIPLGHHNPCIKENRDQIFVKIQKILVNVHYMKISVSAKNNNGSKFSVCAIVGNLLQLFLVLKRSFRDVMYDT